MNNIIENLRGLASGEIQPGTRDFGLCRELRLKFDFTIPHKAYESWALWTGRYPFPVPHPTLDPSKAFLLAYDMWSDDEYGDNRRALCRHLADWMEKNLHSPGGEL